MTRPTAEPIVIAKNDNFASGSFAGQPTKTDVPSGILENGFLPNVRPPVDIWNSLLHNHGAWIHALMSRTLRFVALANGPGVEHGVLHDVEIEALHVAQFARARTSFGKTNLTEPFDDFPGAAAANGAVTIAQNPTDKRIVVGRPAVSAIDTDRLFVSTDRQTWTDLGNGNIPADALTPFVWWDSRGVFVIFARNGTDEWNVYSYDGTTVLLAQADLITTSDSEASFSFASGNGISLAILRGSSFVYRSIDLAAWSSGAVETGAALYDLTYVSELGLFVACGRNVSVTEGPCLYTSVDGSSWTRVSITRPWPISTWGTGGILTSICGRYGMLFGAFYTEDNFGTPTDGECYIGFSRDGGITWELFDEVPDAIEQIRPAPSGLALVPHPGAATVTLVSG